MVPKKNISSKKGLTVFILILFLIIDLVFLYFVKYKNQNLSLSDFSFYNIGNFLNFLFIFLLITGLVIYGIRKKNFIKPSLFIVLTTIMTFILVIAVLTTLINFNFPEYYIADQPLSKIITGILFFSYQFIQFIFISVLWLSLLGRKDLLALRAITDSAVLAIVFILFSFFFLNFKMDEIKKSPLIKNTKGVAVVLGAAVWSGNKPSPSLASRADKAAELIKNNVVEKIVFTGGNAPGELSEAEVAFKYILKNDIDSSDIVIEKNTTSTSEQILFIKNQLMNRYEKSDIIIISDAYHLPRIKEICKFFDIKVSVVASDLRLSFDNNIYYRIRESIALLVFWFFAL